MILFLQFNDLDEETLIRDRTPQKFRVHERLLKNLLRVFPDELACLIQDSICGIDDEFKIPLNEEPKLETETEETCENFNTQNEEKRIPAYSVTESGQAFNVTLDDDATQFDAADTLDETIFKLPLPINENQDFTAVNMKKNPEQTTKKIWESRDFKPEEEIHFTVSSNPEVHSYLLNNTSQKAEFHSRNSLNVEQSKMELLFPECHPVDPWEITQTDQNSFDSPLHISNKIDGDANTLDALIEKKLILRPESESSKYRNQEPQLFGTQRGPEIKSLKCQQKIGMTDTILQRLDFYPQDTDDELNSQLARLVLEETETQFFDSLDWNSLNIQTQVHLDEQCIYLQEFFCAVTHFNYLMDSKPFSKVSEAHDNLKDEIFNANNTGQQRVSQLCSSNSYDTFTTTNWWEMNKKKKDREEKLTKLLKEIFKYLTELINDFSKLHTTIFDYHDFLIKNVFPVIQKYFDERSSDQCINDLYGCESLNICCNFIKTTVHKILASDELCGFLKWEEQRYLLSELCGSKIISQNILDFLLTQTVTALKSLEEKQKKEHQRIFQDPQIIDKFSIIFPMIECLIKKFIESLQREIETSDCQNNEEDRLFFLWKEEALVEKNVIVDILQDSNSNENEDLDDRWIQDLELLVQLTKEQLIIFSLTAQRSLQAFKEARGGSKITFTFSQSQTISSDKQCKNQDLLCVKEEKIKLLDC